MHIPVYVRSVWVLPDGAEGSVVGSLDEEAEHRYVSANSRGVLLGDS